MILWGRATSVNVQKVLWALTECDLSFDHNIVGGKHGGLDTPDFKALSPMPRVPVLQDGETVLWESHAILRYLAAKTGSCTVTPEADMWMEFGSTTLQPPFIGLFWQLVRMTPEEQDNEVQDSHLKSLTRSLSVLNSSLSDGRSFVAGPSFSMADVALGSLFYRILDLFPDILAEMPSVAKWHGTILARPGYQQWIATSYDDLRVAQ